MKKLVSVSTCLFLMTTASMAFAAVDLAPIQSAQADLLAYAGALLALGVAVWGAMKVVAMFRGK